MKVMIHACPDREHYVEKHLLPQLRMQGIKDEEIALWMDENGEGNLWSFVHSCEACAKQPGGTWHIQDDVILSRKFAETIRANDEGVAYGFCNKDFDRENVDFSGRVPLQRSWNSFQCVRIPNEYAKWFAWWIINDAQHRYDHVRRMVNTRKCDDDLFKAFLREWHPDEIIHNLKPNIVDHIDYLLGGSMVNRGRQCGPFRAAYWEDEDLVEKMEKKIKVTEAR